MIRAFSLCALLLFHPLAAFATDPSIRFLRAHYRIGAGDLEGAKVVLGALQKDAEASPPGPLQGFLIDVLRLEAGLPLLPEGKKLVLLPELFETISAYPRLGGSLGRRLADVGELELARRLLESAAKGSASPRWLAQLILLGEKEGNPEKAIAAGRRALEVDPSLIWVRFKLAKLLARTGVPEEAEEQRREAIELMRKNRHLAFDSGYFLLRRLRDFEGAEAAFEVFGEGNQGRRDHHFAQIEFMKKNIDQAESLSLKAIRWFEDRGEKGGADWGHSYRNLSMYLNRFKRHERALEISGKALEAARGLDRVRLLIEHSVAALGAGRLDGVESRLSRGIEESSTGSGASLGKERLLASRGLVREANGETLAALEDFSAARWEFRKAWPRKWVPFDRLQMCLSTIDCLWAVFHVADGLRWSDYVEAMRGGDRSEARRILESLLSGPDASVDLNTRDRIEARLEALR